MKIGYLALALSIPLAACGSSKLKRDNERLSDENTEARQQRDESQAKAEQAERDAADSRDRAEKAESERAAAQKGQIESQAEKQRAEQAANEAALAAAAAKDKQVAAESEAEKQKQTNATQAEQITTLNATLSESAGLPLKPFNGVWISEKRVAGIPETCESMILVAGIEVTEAILCADGQVQLRQQSVNRYSVKGDIFPGSLGLVGQLGSAKSSCLADQVSVVAQSSQLVFDYASSASATPATYLFALDENKGRRSFQSGALSYDLNRQSSCEAILAAASSDAATPKTKLAAGLCKKSFSSLGCFTSSGFIKN